MVAGRCHLNRRASPFAGKTFGNSRSFASGCQENIQQPIQNPRDVVDQNKVWIRASIWHAVVQEAVWRVVIQPIEGILQVTVPSSPETATQIPPKCHLATIEIAASQIQTQRHFPNLGGERHRQTQRLVPISGKSQTDLPGGNDHAKGRLRSSGSPNNDPCLQLCPSFQRRARRGQE